ncbi:MAG: hypothetical protein A3I24_03215 [Candidatus Harrisonbacteria bacterium RIFCSPLOWO2_02_FULL_41_13b]|uniref:DUF4134 domain-containing protein n=1 Tax=Candidatus Harrisonbacteria bacterium RIFCSPLOWO2_02_FULL_41_13b TaxID=1798409 RepID=A0A1G1ZU22_9BACT|nr:MAG: hypothetical protein A3I24_03215 [Candidatus Harrisonbacteria bacterium RIFCSPLOWO2_02_FULL_41_13b]
MKSKLINILIFAGLAAILFFSSAANGAEPPGPATMRLFGIINTLTNFLLGLLIALSIIFIIYAAFLYLTAAGEEENYKTAKQVIWYAIIAIAVGLLSKAIVYITTALIS